MRVVTGSVLAGGGGTGAQLPGTLALLGAAAAVALGYRTGLRRLGRTPASATWARRRYAFWAGLLIALAALAPPLDAVTEGSFPAHMVTHMVLLLGAAPLLAAGACGLPLLLALPRTWRRRIAGVRAWGPVRRGRALAGLPALRIAAWAAVLWGWHLPTLYTAALTSPAVHALEHACYLAAGWWLWAELAEPGRRRDGRAVLYVFLSALPMSALGAVLTFAPVPLYPAQTGTGPDALAQQQLAGLVMWVPADFAFLGACAALMLLWLRRLDRSAPGAAPLPPAVPPAPALRPPALRPPAERRAAGVAAPSGGPGCR